MDEHKWARARDLAGAFAEAYSEPVAEALGDALLTVLAELLPMEQETVFTEAPDSDEQFAKMQARAQHPAFLEGEKAYAAAPLGTTVVCLDADHSNCYPLTKTNAGWFGNDNEWPGMQDKRRVLQWGSPS